MAILLIIGLGLGYALSLWFLWQQMHFNAPPAEPPHAAPDTQSDKTSRAHPDAARPRSASRRPAAQPSGDEMVSRTTGAGASPLTCWHHYNALRHDHVLGRLHCARRS